MVSNAWQRWDASWVVPIWCRIAVARARERSRCYSVVYPFPSVYGVDGGHGRMISLEFVGGWNLKRWREKKVDVMTRDGYGLKVQIPTV